MSDENALFNDENLAALHTGAGMHDISSLTKPSNVMQESQFLSTAAAAKMLGLSTTLIQTLVDQGELKGWKTRGGHRRIAAESIIEYQALTHHPVIRQSKTVLKPKVSVVVERPDWMRGLKEDFRLWNLAVNVTFFDSVTEALLDLASNRPDMIVVEMSMPRSQQEKTLQALENFNKRGHSPLSAVLVTEEKGLASSWPMGSASSIQLVPGPLSSIWLHAYLTGVVASCKN
jgi:excisionase family DNA binding protein